MRNYRNFSIILLLAGTMLAISCAKPGPVTEVQASAPDPRLSAAEEMIKKMPDSPIGYNQLAASYIKSARRSGDFSLNSKAEAAVNKALEIDATDVTARKLRASLQLTFHKFSDALESGNALLRDFPKDAFVYGVLTDANVELGNYQAAAEAAQKMVDLKPNTASYARVGHIRSLYGDSEGAIEAMKTAARSADPQDPEEQSWCLVRLADEMRKNGKYPEAEKVYAEALTILPDFHLSLAGMGKARAALGDTDGAIKYLSDSINRVPNADAVIMLGDLYTLQGNIDKARQQYDLAEVLEKNLGTAGDQKRLALLWADQNVKLDEALAIAESEYAARKDIYTADVYAWCLYRKGRFADAKVVIDKALVLKTKDARIMYHAGMIEKALGNTSNSVKLLKAAMALDPKFDLIQSAEASRALGGAV